MPNETISIYNTTISPFTIQVPPFTAPIRRPFLSARSAAPGHCVSRHPGHALPHGQCLWPPGGGNSVMDPWRYRGTMGAPIETTDGKPFEMLDFSWEKPWGMKIED